MNFLKYIDSIYSEELKKFDIDLEREEFNSFISIEPLNYSTKNTFIIMKQIHSKLFVVIGKQRIYLSDLDIIRTILSLDTKDITWFFNQLCNLYINDNNVHLFKINEKKFAGSGIGYFSNDKEIMLYTDSIISINDFVFILNFVLAKDSAWGEMKKLINFRKLTLCKYISLISYYAFSSNDAKKNF